MNVTYGKMNFNQTDADNVREWGSPASFNPRSVATIQIRNSYSFLIAVIGALVIGAAAVWFVL